MRARSSERAEKKEIYSRVCKEGEREGEGERGSVSRYGCGQVTWTAGYAVCL